MHEKIINEIFNKALSRINFIPNDFIEAERGRMRINEYIYTINQEVNYGGHLELSLDYDLYNINIAEYIDIRDKENNLLSLNFVK